MNYFENSNSIGWLCDNVENFRGSTLDHSWNFRRHPILSPGVPCLGAQSLSSSRQWSSHSENSMVCKTIRVRCSKIRETFRKLKKQYLSCDKVVIKSQDVPMLLRLPLHLDLFLLENWIWLPRWFRTSSWPRTVWSTILASRPHWQKVPDGDPHLHGTISGWHFLLLLSAS